MKKLMILGTTVALGLSAAACGTTPTDRAISGAAIGAGAGALGAHMMDGNVGNAAIWGAGLGAGAGLLTNPNQVYFGEPAWNGYGY